MNPSTYRVYYALWPDAEARAALASAAAAALPTVAVRRGRPVRAEALHLTLAFVGAVPSAVVGALARLGAAIAWPAATLRFGKAQWWPASGSLVLLADEVPAALAEAREALCARLVAHGVPVDTRPFRAHVTIARGVVEAPHTMPVALEWTASHVALVESQPGPDGPSYRPLALWEAHGASAGFQ